MQSLIGFLNVLLPLAYLICCGAYYWVFHQNSDASRRASRIALAMTILLHLTHVTLRAIAFRQLPIATNPEFFSLMALALLMLYLVIEIRTGVVQTGLIVTGLAFVLQFVGSAFTSGPAPHLFLLTDPGYALHAALVLLAYTAMSLSFIYAVVYMIQSRQLRTRHFGLFFRRMPPLETLERMSVGAVKLAVPLLFIALAMGHLWMYSLRDKVSPELAATLSPYDPKVISSWIVFLIYAVGVTGHQLMGWRGRRMNILAIIAFLSVLLAMGMIHHFFPSFHDFSMQGGLS